jgi:rubrerythrin
MSYPGLGNAGENKPQNQDVGEMIKEAMKDEKTAISFYRYLMDMAPNSREKEIIKGIRDDEKKHYEMFKRMHFEMTGMWHETEDVKATKPKDYKTGIEHAIFDELGAVEFYRQIMFKMTDQRYRDMLFEIITDEQEHAAKFLIILTKHK